MPYLLIESSERYEPTSDGEWYTDPSHIRSVSVTRGSAFDRVGFTFIHSGDTSTVDLKDSAPVMSRLLKIWPT